MKKYHLTEPPKIKNNMHEEYVRIYNNNTITSFPEKL